MRAARMLPCIAAMAVLLLAASSRAQTAPAVPPATAAAAAEMKLDLVTEEGQPLIRAVLTQSGKPVENASILFGVRRSFGTLVIGEDKTLDDGSAAVRFPQNLPGGQSGELHIVAQVKSPPDFAAVRGHVMLAGVKVAPPADPFPRALWAPHAPLQLVIPIVVLLGGVWATYAYVVVQVIAIRRGGRT